MYWTARWRIGRAACTLYPYPYPYPYPLLCLTDAGSGATRYCTERLQYIRRLRLLVGNPKPCLNEYLMSTHARTHFLHVRYYGMYVFFFHVRSNSRCRGN